MLEKKSSIPIPLEEFDVPPVPVQDTRLSGRELAAIYSNLNEFSQVFVTFQAVTVTEAELHMSIMNRVLVHANKYPGVIKGIAHIFNRLGRGKLQIHLNKDNRDLLDFCADVTKAASGTMRPQLNLTNQDYYLEVSY